MVYGVTTDTHLTNLLVLTGSLAYGVLYMIPLFILNPDSIIEEFIGMNECSPG